MKSGIYRITNTENGKIYIGSAVNLKQRKSQHLSRLRRNKHWNNHLQHSYNKYGESSFKFDTIMHCLKEHLIFFEQKHIDKYNLKKELYNLSPTAGSPLGFKHTDETKAKMSKIHMGNCHNKGRVLPEIHRKRIWDGSTTRKAIIVHKYDTGEFVGEYIGLKECARQLNLDSGTVCKTLKGDRGRKQHKGYTFKYKLKEEK